MSLPADGIFQMLGVGRVTTFSELFGAFWSYFERCRNKAPIQLFALFDGQSSAEALGLSIEIESNVGGWSYGGGVLRQDAAPEAPSEHVRDPAGWAPQLKAFNSGLGLREHHLCEGRGLRHDLQVPRPP